MRNALLLFALSILTGCATGGPSADVEPEGWCRVSVTNESGQGLKLLYYREALGRGEVTVGEVAVGATTEFSAPCALGTIRVLGYPRDTLSRTLIARTGDIRLDPAGRVRGVLRPVR